MQGVCANTPLQEDAVLSKKYNCKVYLKREDQQEVRSYKIRGAFNKISSLSEEQRLQGIVCASAGNHAQGVAYCCKLLNIHGTVFMPANTPVQKVERVEHWGGEQIDLFLHGENYDECFEKAMDFQKASNKVFIHPFDDDKIIEGQATIGKEITDVLEGIDMVVMPIGGGGLAAGVSSWFSQKSPLTKLVGVEPEGAASMTAAMEAGKPICLRKIDPFVDGAAVRQVGERNYAICKDTLSQMIALPEGRICSTLLELYNDRGIVVEPAGAMSICALEDLKEDIQGKTVVCIVSGSNNDAMRMDEIRKLADDYTGLRHHLIIRFSHYPDGLEELFSSLLGDGNYVTKLDYNRREHGRSTYGLVGIKSSHLSYYEQFIDRLRCKGVEHKELSKDDFLFKYWV